MYTLINGALKSAGLFRADYLPCLPRTRMAAAIGLAFSERGRSIALDFHFSRGSGSNWMSVGRSSAGMTVIDGRRRPADGGGDFGTEPGPPLLLPFVTPGPGRVHSWRGQHEECSHPVFGQFAIPLPADSPRIGRAQCTHTDSGVTYA